LLAALFERNHIFALDFHNWYWPAGERLLHGQNLYAQPYPWGLNYPALAALMFVPFALLPHGFADVLFTILVLLAVPATLRLLNVSDWRVYGIAMLWAPVVFGWQTANLSLLLVLGVAAAWRYRDSPVVTGVIVAVLVSAKLFLWPLGLWLLATRRYLALGWAVASAAILSTAAFAVVGFAQLSQYINQTHKFLADAERRSYGLVSLALHLGAGRTLAYAVLIVVSGIVAIACVTLGRLGRDRQALAACIAVSVLASPVIEAHYLALLLVPAALTRPRLSALWALPIALWVTPADWPADWQRVVFLGIGTAVLAVAMRQQGLTDKPGQGSGSGV
jgi:hypothetical protein